MTGNEHRGDLLELLRARFQASGLSIKALADRAGIPYAAVYNAVNGKSDPQLSTVSRLCAVLGLTLKPSKRKAMVR